MKTTLVISTDELLGILSAVCEADGKGTVESIVVRNQAGDSVNWASMELVVGDTTLSVRCTPEDDDSLAGKLASIRAATLNRYMHAQSQGVPREDSE